MFPIHIVFKHIVFLKIKYLLKVQTLTKMKHQHLKELIDYCKNPELTIPEGKYSDKQVQFIEERRSLNSSNSK